jgi:hypothetical protein
MTTETRGYRYKHGDRPLEGFTVQRAAGRGGFGEVYYALSDSGREVALKIVQAYEQIEVRGIGQCMNLKSPHLVTIFDVKQPGDTTDGHPIVIMEYVSGPSLRELLDDAPSGLGQQKAAFFLREIGKGLTYLHDCGIVHRDLKPANIFYENGYVKIGDYGLSKAISSSHRSGQTMTVGTVHYMAPEVGAGRYDRSIDIYALGVLLYEMLTGHPPFYGASAAEVLMKHLGTPVDVSGVPEPFAGVILKAMAKDPAQRYETVQQMVEAVFGAEHVRESVSCFSPENLTLVAGRVADRAGIFPAGRVTAPPRPHSSRAYELAADERDAVDRARETWADRVGARFARMAHHVGGIGDGVATLIGARRRRPLRPPGSAESAGGDPMPQRHRRLLVFFCIAAIAVSAGIFAPAVEGGRSTPALGWMVFLCTLGATLGVMWSARGLLPSLAAESRFLRHLAVGGVASLAAVLLTFPTFRWLAEEPHIGQTFGAMCLGFFVLDWHRRTRPDREERLSLGSLINCLLLGLIIGGILDANIVVVVAILCGASIAVQISAPWIPQLAERAATAAVAAAAAAAAARPPVAGPPPLAAQLNGPPPQPPAEPAMPASSSWDAAPPKENGMSITRMNLGPLKFFAMSPAEPPRAARDPDRVGFFGTIVRLPFVLLGTVLLLAAFAVACAVAFDTPSLIASGRLGADGPRVFQRAFGTVQWPGLLRRMGEAAMVVAGLLAVVIFMLVRRHRGGGHMTRAIPGVILLLAAPFMLVAPAMIWLPAPGWVRIDWGLIVDDLLNHVTRANTIRAGAAVIGGLLLLLWPAGRRRRRRREEDVVQQQQQQQQQQPGGAGAPPPMPTPPPPIVESRGGCGW